MGIKITSVAGQSIQAFASSRKNSEELEHQKNTELKSHHDGYSASKQNRFEKINMHCLSSEDFILKLKAEHETSGQEKELWWDQELESKLPALSHEFFTELSKSENVSVVEMLKLVGQGRDHLTINLYDD